MTEVSDIINWLGYLDVFRRPRFVFSSAHDDCREKVVAPNGDPVYAIRLDVKRFWWGKRESKPCEVILIKLEHQRRVILEDETRLRWKDSTDDKYRRTIKTNQLINLCGIHNPLKPSLHIWSEKGDAGYSYDNGAGIYRFHIATVCEGSARAEGVVSVSYDPSQDWQNIYIIAVKQRAKWKSFMLDACVAFGIAGALTYWVRPLLT